MLGRVFFRSFFIQSFLHDKKMQNVGFCYSLFPMIKYLRLNHREEADFRKRHLQFFSTHPCFTAAILGAVVREELDLHNLKDGDRDSYGEEIERHKGP
ncbi:MAG: PTS system mannose/fructose/sorbose family transporter subunit IID [Syntrophobacterales bacterium]|nr:PTS system mannose/fructose/sorbose family transporter subunit IID [Syntrophobacterales bacterium]